MKILMLNVRRSQSPTDIYVCSALYSHNESNLLLLYWKPNKKISILVNANGLVQTRN